jgi:lipocalin-like protein
MTNSAAQRLALHWSPTFRRRVHCCGRGRLHLDISIAETRPLMAWYNREQGETSMKSASRLNLVCFLALAISTLASAAWAADSIVGTWRLVSWTEEETESKTVHKIFGDNPSGLVTFTADDRMMLILIDASHKPPTPPNKATDTEAAQLYQTMLAYAGRYKTENDKLMIYPEIDARRTFTGMELVRSFEVNGDRLQYKTMPNVSPIIGKQAVGSLVWDRVK